MLPNTGLTSGDTDKELVPLRTAGRITLRGTVQKIKKEEGSLVELRASC